MLLIDTQQKTFAVLDTIIFAAKVSSKQFMYNALAG
jgi:hypothetical protein